MAWLSTTCPPGPSLQVAVDRAVTAHVVAPASTGHSPSHDEALAIVCRIRALQPPSLPSP
jgi:hypothetical protein